MAGAGAVVAVEEAAAGTTIAAAAGVGVRCSRAVDDGDEDDA